MATDKETTLQIKAFKGVNRFKGGPTTDPAQFYTLQNLYSPTRDTLESIPGVSDQSGSGIPGITSIKSVEFYENNLGYERLLVWGEHDDISAAPAITSGNFSVVSGVPGGARTFMCTFIGLGGESRASNSVSVNVDDTQFRFTPPTPPTGACGCNLYIINGAQNILIGCCWFANGATSLPYIEIDNTVNTSASLFPVTLNSANVYELRHMGVAISSASTDTDALMKSRTYYVGVAGYLSLIHI